VQCIDLANVEHQLDDDAAERADLLEQALPWARLLGAILDGAPGPWAADAACKGHGAAMFPTKGQPAAPGRTLCERCPVQLDCLGWATTVPADQGGIIAGTTERERQRVRARWAA
jgi:hypothetical protein